ncbi:MAG: protein-glutamate O-methyltransferase CheR [Desulfarculus sp.]|nr:protein-glutamate O-methyltransferase CheR [Desulfarculus sp.]
MVRPRPGQGTGDGANGAPFPGALDCGLGGGFQLTEAQFSKLASLVYRLCGIHLGEGKRELLRARLAKRLRATGCHDVQQYIERLEGDRSGHELVCFLDVITTNKTDFFREPKHFEFLVDEILPRLDKLCHGNEPLRIWSAACSTGEEPYTLAMVLMEHRPLWERRGAGILASDLSTKVLEQAQNGVYAQDRVADIPRPLLTKYFQRGTNRWAGYVRVRPELRKMIQYRRLNLMDNFDFDKPFHVIFCRNVMIYFDKPTQERLVEKFRACLVPGGYLMVGHSESLTGIHHRLAFARPAVYRRQD